MRTSLGQVLGIGLAAAGFSCGDDVAASSDGAHATESLGSGTATATGDGEAGSSETTGPPVVDSSDGFEPSAVCGNGVLELGEDCDDAQDGDNDDECTDACLVPQCGDGFAQDGLFEQCDAGPDGSDECSPLCQAIQAPQWTVFLDHGPGSDGIIDVAIDGGGNTIAVGFAATQSVGTDVWVQKLDPAGKVLWSETVAGPTVGADEQALSVAVTPDDRIIVGGALSASGEMLNGWVGTFGPDGGLLGEFVENFEGGSSDDQIWSVDIGDDGSIYATGYTFATDVPELWYARYDADGSQQWVQREGGSGRFFDWGYGVAVRGDRVLVGGVVNDDVWVRMLDTDGTETWTLSFDAVADTIDAATDVALDDDGNAYVLGSTDFVYVRKFDSTAHEIWSVAYADSGSSAWSMTLNDGALYVSGTERLFQNGRAAAMRKIDPQNGAVRWKQLLNTGETLSYGRGIAARDAVVVTAGLQIEGLDGNVGFVRRFAPAR